MYAGFVQETRHKNQGLFQDFQYQINFFQDQLFFIYRDSNRASQNWECHKYGTLWNLIEFFHWNINWTL